jgi:hypothetical protein
MAVIRSTFTNWLLREVQEPLFTLVCAVDREFLLHALTKSMGEPFEKVPEMCNE